MDLKPTDVVLDNKSELGVIGFIKSLIDKPELLFRFFLQNEYYTVYYEDADRIASDYYHTKAVLKFINNVPCLAISKMMYESILRDILLIKKYRVELYARQEKYGSHGGWCMIKKGSPGNLLDFEDDLFANNEIIDSANIGAIKITNDSMGNLLVGVGFIDTINLELGVIQFTDKENFSNLEAYIIQLGLKECLIYFLKNDSCTQSIVKLLKRNNVMVTDRSKKDFEGEQTELTQDLGLLLSKQAASNMHYLILNQDRSESLGCLTALLSYLRITSDTTLHGKFSLITRDLKQYMKLDTSAYNALNVFPSISTDTNTSSMQNGSSTNVSGLNSNNDSSTTSIFGLLNHTNTPQGQRLLSCWCKQPLIDKKLIEERHTIVELFVNELALRFNIKEYFLARFPDLNRLCKKLQRGKGSLLDCLKIQDAISKIPKLLEIFSEFKSNENQYLLQDLFVTPLALLNQDFEKLSELVSSTVIYDEASHTAIINPSFDSNLGAINTRRTQLMAKLKLDHIATAKKLELVPDKTLKCETSVSLLWHYRVSRKDENVLRSKVAKTDILETQKNGVKFSSEAVTKINNEYRLIEAEYLEKQALIAKEVIEIVSGYSSPIEVLANLSAVMDVYYSMATLAAHPHMKFVRPIMSDIGKGDIIIKRLRHPCIERQSELKTRKFVPNNVELKRNESNFQIITGPNMGGKSTYIRQVGVCCFLAQIGSFVPCDEANLTIVDSILARIGAGDNQLKGVSTFMVEMVETSHILGNSTSNSLILIDELGRGTSTYDGFGLAYAISEHIVTKLNSFCLFATHFHELTYLEKSAPSVRNLQMMAEKDANSFKLLYKVAPGACGQSFGIHIAKLAHFPPHVIAIAEEKALELETFSFSDPTKDDCDLPPLAIKKFKTSSEHSIETKLESTLHLLNYIKDLPLHVLQQDENELFNQLDAFVNQL